MLPKRNGMTDKTCKQCGKSFEINEISKGILEQMNMPEPELCGSCATAWFMSFRNERIFYPSSCQKCGKKIIGMYPQDTKYVVWCRDCWWGDTWDAKDFAQEYKGPETFFQQMKELQMKVPREGLVSLNAENSEYSNHIRDSKNCYMSFGVAEGCEECYYSFAMSRVQHCSDTAWAIGNELINNCIFVNDCYNCSFVFQAYNCTDCHYSYDLKGCSNCMFSSNLRNKQYVFRNKQLTKEDYEKEVAKIHLESYKNRQEYFQEYLEVIRSAIHKFSNQSNCQDCSGENIHNSVNTQYTFGAYNNENIFVGTNVLFAKNVVYSFSVGTQPVEYAYNISVIKGGMNVVGCFNIVQSNDVMFSENLVSCSDCIGCIGLNKKSFCILNKQYSELEYNKIKSELLAYWSKNGQLANFMPKNLSCFAYNETIANDYYPQEKNQAIDLGYSWQENLPGSHGKETMSTEDIPDNILETDESICEKVFACINCKRNYKVIKPELALYKKLLGSIPRECFDCRYKRILKMMGKRALFPGNCSCKLTGHDHQGQCQNTFLTIYNKDTKLEKVFCESCYQKEVA